MKDYIVTSPIKTEAGIIPPGKPITLSDEDAAELKALGCVQDAPAPAQPTVPTDPAARQAAIVEAIGKLDKDNADLWLKDNRPDATALSTITGWTVTAAERNDAWASMQPAA